MIYESEHNKDKYTSNYLRKLIYDYEEKLEILKKDIDFTSLVNSLVQEKSRFKSIFRTEKGSYYFVLLSGETVRFKNENTSVTPFMKYIFFIDESSARRLVEFTKEFKGNNNIFKILGPIKTYPIREGLHPLEVGLVNDPREAVFELIDDNLFVKGSKFKDEEFNPDYSGPWHLGHKITHII